MAFATDEEAEHPDTLDGYRRSFSGYLSCALPFLAVLKQYRKRLLHRCQSREAGVPSIIVVNVPSIIIVDVRSVKKEGIALAPGSSRLNPGGASKLLEVVRLGSASERCDIIDEASTVSEKSNGWVKDGMCDRLESSANAPFMGLKYPLSGQQQGVQGGQRDAMAAVEEKGGG